MLQPISRHFLSLAAAQRPYLRHFTLQLSSRAMASSITPGKKYRYVVLGGGVAAGYAAEAFQQNGIGGVHAELLIVSDDKAPPYERPALSKGFLAPEKPARLPGFHTPAGSGGEPHDGMWYARHGIEFRGKTKVEEFHPDERQLVTHRGAIIEYEKLILATGCSPLYLDNLGDGPSEVIYVRNIGSAEDLAGHIKALKGKGHAIVVGMGYLGMEIGSGILSNDMKLTMIAPGARFLPNVYTDKAASVYHQAYKDRGTQFVDGKPAKVTRNEQGKVNGVELEDGRKVEGDFVVVAVGATPNLDLFKDKLDISKDINGVVVDDHLRTSDPNVYAVGDIAAFPLKIEQGKLVRQEHVQNARESAQHAVKAILAADGVLEQDPGPYDYLPYFYSRVLNFSWKSYGVQRGDAHHFGEFKEGKTFGAFWIDNNHIVGTFLESANDEQHSKMKELARSRPLVDERQLRDILRHTFGEEMPTAAG